MPRGIRAPQPPPFVPLYKAVLRNFPEPSCRVMVLMGLAPTEVGWGFTRKARAVYGGFGKPPGIVRRGLNGFFSPLAPLALICVLLGALPPFFPCLGGGFVLHQSAFFWPDSLSFAFWLLFFSFLFSAPVCGRPRPLLALLACLGCLGALSFPLVDAWGPPPLATPTSFFGWGSIPHAGFLLAWRDLSFLLLLGGGLFLGSLPALFSPLPGLAFGASSLGALWALTATTPPLLWAGDGIELATLLSLAFLLLWAHLWPLSPGELLVWASLFPSALLCLQGLGAWTFHHDATLTYASPASLGLPPFPPTPQPPAWAGLSLGLGVVFLRAASSQGLPLYLVWAPRPFRDSPLTLTHPLPAAWGSAPVHA
jgi:hypothetical protein